MADEDALLDAQLSEEVFQVPGHGFVGEHRAVRAVAMVTGIYCQHLTGQRTVRTLGVGGKEATEQRQHTFFPIRCVLASEQESDSEHKGRPVHASSLSVSILLQQRGAEDLYQITSDTG